MVQFVGISFTGFSLFFPSLNNISFSDNLSGFSSTLSAECWAVYYALLQIQSLSVDNFLIVYDSQSALLALNSNPFSSKVSQLMLRIRSIIVFIKKVFLVEFWMTG